MLYTSCFTHPDPDKVDFDLAREGALERVHRSLLSEPVGDTLVPLVQVIGERNRLFVSGGEKPDALQHACEGAGRESAPGESEPASHPGELRAPGILTMLPTCR